MTSNKQEFLFEQKNKAKDMSVSTEQQLKPSYELLYKSSRSPIAALLLARYHALTGSCDDAIAILEEALSLDSLNYSLFSHNIACWMIDGTGCPKDTVGGANLLRSALAFAKRHDLDISSDILFDLAYYLETEQIEPKNGLSRKEEFIRCAIFADLRNPLWAILHIGLRNIGLAEYMPSVSLRFYERYKDKVLASQVEMEEFPTSNLVNPFSVMSKKNSYPIR